MIINGDNNIFRWINLWYLVRNNVSSVTITKVKLVSSVLVFTVEGILNDHRHLDTYGITSLNILLEVTCWIISGSNDKGTVQLNPGLSYRSLNSSRCFAQGLVNLVRHTLNCLTLTVYSNKLAGINIQRIFREVINDVEAFSNGIITSLNTLVVGVIGINLEDVSVTRKHVLAINVNTLVIKVFLDWLRRIWRLVFNGVGSCLNSVSVQVVGVLNIRTITLCRYKEVNNWGIN